MVIKIIQNAKIQRLCSQDSFAIKHLYPIHCLVPSRLISYFSFPQVPGRVWVWGAADLGLGLVVWLWGCHFTSADSELLAEMGAT